MGNAGPPTLVLKLGGSLAENGRLKSIAALVARARIPVVVVPGGGPFADAVRQAQPLLGITDTLAHRLALLAMHQMGLVIAALDARFVTAGSLDDIHAALARDRIPVWLPFALQHDDATLPADWTVTSDALAARLAERLCAPAVVLLKSGQIPSEQSLEMLTSAGIVDPWFEVVVARAGLDWHLSGNGDEAALAARLGAAH